MKIKELNYEFVRIPTIGDGSCLLHALLYCCSGEYIKKDRKERMKMVRELRIDLANILDFKIIDDKTIYQTLSRGELEEISKNVKEVDKKYMQRHLKSPAWLTASYIELLSLMFNINIIFISFNTKKIYKTGDKELLFQDRNTIFINYIEQGHFESLGIMTDDGMKTYFSKNSPIVKEIKKCL